jgi:hypothetical protein
MATYTGTVNWGQQVGYPAVNKSYGANTATTKNTMNSNPYTFPSGTTQYQVGAGQTQAKPKITPGQQATVGTGQSFTWSPPAWLQGQTQEGWGSDAMSKAMQNYQQVLPYVQAQQNAMQYGMDFNENQRRWNDQFGWTQQNDQFNQNLASKQQTMAEWVAQQQQGNWGKQFGLDQELGRGNLALGNRDLDVKDWYNRQQVGIAQQQNQIDQMWKSGQLSNQQRELALGELTQQQLNTYRNAQLAQEAALTRENYANQKQLAAMQAFGRQQMPQSRWVRSW